MKQLYFSILLSTIFFTQPVLGQPFSGGSGTSGDPFWISTAADLDNIRNYLGDASTIHYFEQKADIDLGGIPNWEPIGGGGTTNKFQGHYNGNGYAISNLSINRPGTNNIGLFGHISPLDEQYGNSLSIVNVVLINVDIRGARGTGSLVGRVTGNEHTLIESCYVIKGTVSGDAETGGLVGSNNSYGISGISTRRPIITKSFANVEVNFSGNGTSNEKFGGLVGSSKKGIISNSFSLSPVNVSGSVSRVGGLAGCVDSLGRIEYSYSAGLVNINHEVSLAGGLLGSLGLLNPGAVLYSYWDIETSGQTTSAGGDGKTTSEMQNQGTYSGWNFTAVWEILEGETYPFLRDLEISGFEISDPGTQTAGSAFNIQVNDAVDIGGNRLNGNYHLTITSDIETEGPLGDGVLYDAVTTFEEGVAIVEGIILTNATTQVLSASIATIKGERQVVVSINPAVASRLAISTQPLDVEGLYDDKPVPLTPVVIEIQDQYGNPSSSGLADPQNITATLSHDGSLDGNASLAGTTMLDIQTGPATFDNLTIDREGTGYILSFVSDGLESVESSPFDVGNIVDLSGFDIQHPGRQHANVLFDLNISNAKGSSGVNLSGAFNVTVTSDLDMEIFNLEVDFTDGAATLSILLATIDSHDITVGIEGVRDEITLIDIEVAPDLSGFILSTNPDGGPFYSTHPFMLLISEAKDLDGELLNGNVSIIVTSNQPAEVQINTEVVFVSGEAQTELVLTYTELHTLTIGVAGITEPLEINIDVWSNQSGFTLEVDNEDDKTAGESFDLIISEATDLAGFDLNGEIQVTVNSDIEGFISNSNVVLGENPTTVGVILTLAGSHTLTVSITGITNPETANVQVIAGIATKLSVALQPIGGNGSNNDVAVGIGAVEVITVDNYGNPSAPIGAYSISVSLYDEDSQVEEIAVLGNSESVELEEGIALFNNLTVDKDGTYILRFDSGSPGDFEEVYSEPFVMTNVEDQSGFDIVDPGPQVAGTPFDLYLKHSRSTAGELLQGNHRVTLKVWGGFMWITLIDNAPLLFYEGETIIKSIFQFGNQGAFDIEITIENITGKELYTLVVVAADLSGFDVTHPGQQIIGSPFNLAVTGAIDAAGNDLTGNRKVTVTSNHDVQVEQFVSFVNGVAEVPVILMTEGTHILTVDIDWVTAIKVIEDVEVSYLVWEGGNGDWSLAANWLPEIEPNEFGHIRIPSGNPEITNSVTVNNVVISSGAGITVTSAGELTIKEDGSLTVQAGGRLTSTGTMVNNAGTGGLIVESDENLTGSVIQNSPGVQATVQRYVTGGKWHIISSPVSGQSIAEFLSGNIAHSSVNNNYALTHYDEKKETSTAGGWGSYYTSSTGGSLIVGKGYLAARSNDKSYINFAGILTSENISIPITKEGHGWNAIGNPFASAIRVTEDAGTQNFLTVNKDQIDESYGAIYLYDPGDHAYKIINNVPIEADQLEWDYIQPGQGFIVKSRELGGNIVFTQGMRFHDEAGPSFFMKSLGSPWSKINLRVDFKARSSSTLIAFNSNMTKGLDPTYDAGQFGADAGFRLYTRLVEMDNGVNFAIQALPDYDLEEMVIPVGFDFSEGGEVTFSAVDIQLPGGVSAILEDRQLGTLTDLKEKNYTVALDANSSGPGRFYVYLDIRITNTDEVTLPEEDVIEIYSSGKEIHIIGEIGNDSYATLYDLMGRQIKVVKLERGQRNSFKVDELKRGVYLIRVEGEGAGHRKRLFIE